MSRAAPYLPTLLRASFLVLLVLGIVAKPVLSQVGELHASDHASLADGHGHDDDQGGDGSKDHTEGEHGLMHQAGSGGLSGDIVQLNLVSLAHDGVMLLPMPDETPVPQHPPGPPFRPPIA